MEHGSMQASSSEQGPDETTLVAAASHVGRPTSQQESYLGEDSGSYHISGIRPWRCS